MRFCLQSFEMANSCPQISRMHAIRMAIRASKAANRTIGPFIQGKIRRELYHLYEHVLSKTKTARINGSHLFSALDSFSCECCPSQRQSNVARQKLTHSYYAFASYVRRECHLYEVFLVLTKT